MFLCLISVGINLRNQVHTQTLLTLKDKIEKEIFAKEIMFVEIFRLNFFLEIFEVLVSFTKCWEKRGKKWRTKAFSFEMIRSIDFQLKTAAIWGVFKEVFGIKFR